jgi:hypothetical protein
MSTEHPKYNAFLEDVKDALYYAWDAPIIDDDGVNDFIVKSAKLQLSFSRKYRMVCKRKGQPSKASVEIVGDLDAEKALCSEIIFTKDFVSGNVNRYECNEFNKKSGRNEIIPVSRNDIFVRSDEVHYGRLSISDVVTLKIPACFSP